MKNRFYRIAEPGGGSGAAGDPASATHPGAQGGDGGNADPNKSAASAAAKPEGSGGGASSAQPQAPAAPATLEEALTQLAERDKRISEYEGKVKSAADEAKGTIKALKEKFAGKMNKIRSVKAQPEFDAGEEIKPRGADGKYTPKDLEEIQMRANRRAAAETKSAQMQEAMDEYVRAYAKDAGLDEAELVKLDEMLQSYRRLFYLEDGEKETDPVASPEQQVEMFELMIRGRMAPQLLEAEYKRGYADAERALGQKLGEQGPTGGAPLPTGSGSNAQPIAVHPSAAAAMDSMKRLAG